MLAKAAQQQDGCIGSRMTSAGFGIVRSVLTKKDRVDTFIAICPRSVKACEYCIYSVFCDKKSIWGTIGECIFLGRKISYLLRIIKILESLYFPNKTRNKKITDSVSTIRYFW